MNESRLRRDVAETLYALRKKRVQLWSHEGELRYKAPKGALSAQELETLRSLSGPIVALLDQSASSRRQLPKLVPRATAAKVPLTFSQLRYWHGERLMHRRSLRSVAGAVRMRGYVDVELLRDCLSYIIHRHEALRTRIALVENTPVQQVCDEVSCEFQTHDLRGEPDDARRAITERHIQALILEPVDVCSGPLFGARLIRWQRDEHVLALALEHIISDGISLNILLRDVLAAYELAARGHALSLPAIAIQFADYAVWQREALPHWLSLHGDYWTQRLAGCGRVRLPQAFDAHSDGASQCAALPVRIDEGLRTRLSEWCRFRRTTLVLTVFTAFVALVLRVSEARDAVVRFQTDGRNNPLLQQAVGYFASVLNLRVQSAPGDRLTDLLARVTEEYCAASEHADASYVDAQLPTPELTRNCAFNWVPQGLAAASGSPAALRTERYDFAMPSEELDQYQWDHEPILLLFDKGAVVEGSLIYSPRQLSVRAIESFRDNFLTLLEALLNAPAQPIDSIELRR